MITLVYRHPISQLQSAAEQLGVMSGVVLDYTSFTSLGAVLIDDISCISGSDIIRTIRIDDTTPDYESGFLTPDAKISPMFDLFTARLQSGTKRPGVSADPPVIVLTHGTRRVRRK